MSILMFEWDLICLKIDCGILSSVAWVCIPKIVSTTYDLNTQFISHRSSFEKLFIPIIKTYG